MRDSKAVAALEEFGGVAVAAQAVEGAGGEEDARGAGADGGGADYAVDDGGDDGDSAADEGDYEGGLGGGSGGDGEGGVVGSSVVGWGSQQGALMWLPSPRSINDDLSLLRRQGGGSTDTIIPTIRMLKK